eukprot:COSAG01_NODE_2187_length_8196_cov_76.436458_9_plen_105_part_00
MLHYRSRGYWVAVPRGLHPLRPNREVGRARRTDIHRAVWQCSSNDQSGHRSVAPGRIMHAPYEVQHVAQSHAARPGIRAAARKRDAVRAQGRKDVDALVEDGWS